MSEREKSFFARFLFKIIILLIKIIIYYFVIDPNFFGDFFGA